VSNIVNLNTPQAVAALIDHTLLKPEATQGDIAHLCAEAQEFGFASACINPCWVRFAATQLAGAKSRVCTVIGFPLGANQTRTKIAEAELALTQGATELDMVQNIGALRSGQLSIVRDEITAIAQHAHSRNAIVKVILETCLLTEEEKITACRIAVESRADFVKTSTGFSISGATVEDVKLMRETVGESVGVKASGGIRTVDDLRRMIAAGANRIGTSSGVAILRGLRSAESSDEPTALHAAKVPGGHIDGY
jgi:deoxyribose-phosphate aldolase